MTKRKEGKGSSKGGAYFDGSAFGGVDAAGFHGWDDSAVGGVGDSVAVLPSGTGAVGECEVLVFGDKTDVLEGGFDV